MEKQTVQISLNRYEELVKAEQKAKQYKQFLMNYHYKNKFSDVLLAIEQKNICELINEERMLENNENHIPRID